MRAAARLDRLTRLATSRARALPDFLVIGAQRAGSTSLFDYLCRHPQVASPSHKEIHFFDQNFFRGEGWYRSHFPPRARLRRLSAVTGEASPYYMFHPQAARRAAAAVPEARLIALLRNPVDRAYSHYQLARRGGHERLGFREALEQESDRLAGEAEQIGADPGYRSTPHRHLSYLARGLYAEQLERWLAVYPRDRMLVLRSEDLFAAPATAYAETLAFLGLPEHELDAFPRRNWARYDELDAATREWLVEYYREPNRRLYELLGRDFGWERLAAARPEPRAGAREVSRREEAEADEQERVGRREADPHR
jgi:hypothetical protein